MIGRWISSFVRTHVLRGFAEAMEAISAEANEPPDSSIPEQLRRLLTPALPSAPLLPASEAEDKPGRRSKTSAA